MATTYTVKCSRCGGTGVYGGHNLSGVNECFKCNGAGQVKQVRYTAEEKAARQAELDSSEAKLLRSTKALGTVKGRAAQISRDAEYGVIRGFQRLRDEEPSRFAQMLDSLDRGRLDDVVRALVAYHEA